ncbi:MAG: hypothetical protein AAB666_00585 [Patescibacteria group bacterium]
MLIFLFCLYTVAVAAVFALLEIQIEGPDGWAAKLPTWKHVGWLQKKFGSKKHLTGYHFYLNIFIFLILQIVFFFIPLSWKKEAVLIGFWFSFLTIEDFLWFIFNPHFGLKTFKAGHPQLWWHTHWFLGLPTFYWLTLPIGIILIGWGW